VLQLAMTIHSFQKECYKFETAETQSVKKLPFIKNKFASAGKKSSRIALHLASLQ